VASPDNVLSAQLALARRGISCGSLDGVLGSQTRAAIRIFQRLEGLPPSGQLDPPTRQRLEFSRDPFVNYRVTADDLARLTPVPTSWFGKSTRERLDFETVLELVAEKFHAHPTLIQKLNPGMDWSLVQAGTLVRAPDAILPEVRGRAAWIRINLGEKSLRVFDGTSNQLGYFPCSIARRVEKRPIGSLRIEKLALNPNYRFDPGIFPESAEARTLNRRLTIPPGPNNPVGTAWIGLSRPGYGIHGTPEPENVGRTESHGCFRLSNWNAEYVLSLAWVGMPVYIDP
jgi:lipoprotein-anchoring transpeptidase ErfK/SrfK